MNKPLIYADFQNADAEGRVRLNCQGTVDDLKKWGVALREGLAVLLYSDDVDEVGNVDELMADAIVVYSEREKCWVAEIDWNQIRHRSEAGHLNGVAGTIQKPVDASKS